MSLFLISHSFLILKSSLVKLCQILPTPLGRHWPECDLNWIWITIKCSQEIKLCCVKPFCLSKKLQPVLITQISNIDKKNTCGYCWTGMTFYTSHENLRFHEQAPYSKPTINDFSLIFMTHHSVPLDSGPLSGPPSLVHSRCNRAHARRSAW